MKLKIKAFTQATIIIALLSGCAPTEGYTDQFPQHVNDVIAKLEAGGFSCENPTVYLSRVNVLAGPALGTEPDDLKCNESDTNILGDTFSIFESESEAASYYQQMCNESDKEVGWFHGSFMISPTVETTFDDWTMEEANELAKILGYPIAQELVFDCDYSGMSW